MSLKIGNLELRYGVILAPMAGYTDRAMRIICREYGAELTYTEMVSAKAVVFGDKKTNTIARIREDEGPVSLQIFGSEPGVMAEAAGILERGYNAEGYVPPAAIDINMGCPVHKIFSNGEGSALMKDPSLIYNIVRNVASAVSLPVTVKMRLGVEVGKPALFECAAAAEEAGAALVAVHGRYKNQLYVGTADMEPIRELKGRLSIPVVANGDIKNASDAIKALEMTGADGIMIGRGAVGNPFIFKEIISALNGDCFYLATDEERIRAAKRQLLIASEDKGEEAAVLEARKQIALYFKGHPGAAYLRGRINTLNSYKDVCAAIDSCYL